MYPTVQIDASLNNSPHEILWQYGYILLLKHFLQISVEKLCFFLNKKFFTQIIIIYFRIWGFEQRRQNLVIIVLFKMFYLRFIKCYCVSEYFSISRLFWKSKCHMYRNSFFSCFFFTKKINVITAFDLFFPLFCLMLQKEMRKKKNSIQSVNAFYVRKTKRKTERAYLETNYIALCVFVMCIRARAFLRYTNKIEKRKKKICTRMKETVKNEKKSYEFSLGGNHMTPMHVGRNEPLRSHII